MEKKSKNKKSRGVVAVIAAALVLVLAGIGVFIALNGAGCVKSVILPLKYRDEIITAADRYGLDRRLVAAVVNTESGFDPGAVSRSGAIGLMQLLPSTAEWIAASRGTEYEDGSLTDPETNLDYGCWLLKFLLDRYGGSVRNALIAYNAGVGRLDEWLKNGADGNGELIDIPYAETRNYVSRINGLIEKYGRYYGNELEN